MHVTSFNEYHYSLHKYHWLSNTMQAGHQKLMIDLKWPNKVPTNEWNTLLLCHTKLSRYQELYCLPPPSLRYYRGVSNQLEISYAGSEIFLEETVGMSNVVRMRTVCSCLTRGTLTELYGDRRRFSRFLERFRDSKQCDREKQLVLVLLSFSSLGLCL